MAAVAVVDADADRRELVARVLEADGHTVTRLAGGEEARSLVESGDARPDVVVVQVAVVGDAERALVASLRGDGGGGDGTRVVVIGRSRGTAEAAGADSALGRPIHADDLRRTVAGLLAGDN